MRVSILLTIATVALLAVSAVSASSSAPKHSAPRTHHSAKAQQYTPAALADQIQSLPGLATQPSFNQFSGYLVVDTAVNRSLHYWYAESQGNPSTDPLIWWSNGGPGCSGLLGLLTEHGPFRVLQDQTEGQVNLEANPNSWNRLANVLYMEAPAGVGFSFSNDQNDYTTGDARTAADNLMAIQLFFERFPQLTNNAFYLTSESYGGHYVPTLTNLILTQNVLPSFAGFLLGNPLTDTIENSVYGQVSTMCGHSLASRPTCEAFILACITTPNNTNSDACQTYQANVVNEAGALDSLGLDYPTCPSSVAESRIATKHFWKNHSKFHQLSPKIKSLLGVGAPLPNGQPMPYDPCTWPEETIYLNRPDVKTALHISPEALPWVGCGDNVNIPYNGTDRATPMEPLYTNIFALAKQQNRNLRMVIYSGDDDSVCGTLGTQEWMYNLFGEEQTSAWTQWYYNSQLYGQQIGGSIVQFTGISLVTIHSAGHMVPTYQPEKSFAVLANYLQGDFSTTSQPSAVKKHTINSGKSIKKQFKKFIPHQKKH